MSSTSESTQQSSSTSSPVHTPENSIIDQISSVASGLASQMFQWAQSTFAQTSQITNQTVGNFFQVSQNMLGLSGNLTSQYNNLFAPENAQLVADANSYASPARMAADMGMAGATQAQAGDNALANSEESLRGFGIDPSSGRYAALDQASRVQNAANVAGAENQQRQADITTGQNLRAEAVQVGAQLPAAIANVNNTAIQANTGAENAELSNANTGVNMFGLPNSFLQTAMQVKLPPMQSQSQSTGQSSSNGNKSQPSGGGGNGSGGNGAGGGSSGPAWGLNMPTGGGGLMNNPNFPGAPQGGGGEGGDQPQGGIGGFGEGTGSVGLPGEGGIDQGPWDPSGLGGSGVIDDNPMQNGGFGQTLPENGIFGGAPGTFGDLGNAGNAGTDGGLGLGDPTYNPEANQPSLPEGWNDPAPQTDNGGAGGWGDSGGNSGGGNYSAPPSDPGSEDGWGGDGGGGDSGYAGGGAVRPHMGVRHLNSGFRAPSMATGGVAGAGGSSPFGGAGTTGGHVPASASPSGGKQVDDINAHVNANEFVIPQDVALWKGQEFFQNLIMQSRKRRMTAPAKPTTHPPAKAAQGQAPTFVSRPMR